MRPYFLLRAGLPALLLVATLSAAAPSSPAQSAPDALLDGRTAALLHEALSGEVAKEHVIAITRHHRIQGSRGYRAAARYVIGVLRDAGFESPQPYPPLGAFLAAGDLDAHLPTPAALPAMTPGGAGAGDAPAVWAESFLSDGVVAYQTWQSPPGWEIASAELRLLEPAPVAGGERLVGFPEIAMSVVTYSNPGDVTAELVWVGSGEREEDYADKDVAGKFVLATGYGGNVHRLAVLEHDAAAVVCFLDDTRAADHPDMLAYTGMWPRTSELSRTTFGFNLTHRQGARLRDMLLAGRKVVLRGQVAGTGLESYFMDVVVATIPGSERPQEEIVFSAHLDHPKESANDNASGSGAILDIACTLKGLIDAGRLPRPKRTLRFLWVPEWNGTMAYIDAHPELAGPALGGGVLADLNMDMVGEDLELLHSRLVLTRTPHSLPSFLDDVMEDMAAMVDRTDVRTPRGGRSAFNYRLTPYSGGSDHMMFLDRKVPAVMFSHEPDFTHHTSEDTPDKVDPVELERCELIATGAAWTLANLTDADAGRLLALCLARGIGRLGDAARTAMDALASGHAGAWLAGPTYGDRSALLSIHLSTALDRERRVLDSIGTLADLPPDERAQAAALLTSTAESLSARFHAATEALEEAGRWQLDPPVRTGFTGVPLRTTRGPLAFDLPERGLPEGAHRAYGALAGDARFELVNLIDGARSVDRIALELSAQFGRIGAADVQHYVEDLVAIGVAAWR